MSSDFLNLCSPIIIYFSWLTNLTTEKTKPKIYINIKPKSIKAIPNSIFFIVTALKSRTLLIQLHTAVRTIGIILINSSQMAAALWASEKDNP